MRIRIAGTYLQQTTQAAAAPPMQRPDFIGLHVFEAIDHVVHQVIPKALKHRLELT
jgi:hypothetical protein